MPLPTSDYMRLASFRHALRRFLHFSEAAASGVGLTGQQYQALLALRAVGEGGRMTISELAGHLFVRHHSAVGLVDRLEAQALLRRRTIAEDRRKVELRLTTKGRRVLARLAAMHRAELRRVGPLIGRLLAELNLRREHG
jgi:DNA-binding MarR family transcriptional regulator